MKNPGITAMQKMMVQTMRRKLRDKPECEDEMREGFTQIMSQGGVEAREIERLWAEVKAE